MCVENSDYSIASHIGQLFDFKSIDCCERPSAFSGLFHVTTVQMVSVSEARRERAYRRPRFINDNAIDFWPAACVLISRLMYLNWIFGDDEAAHNETPTNLHQREAFVVLKHWWPQFAAHHESIFAISSIISGDSSFTVSTLIVCTFENVPRLSLISRPLLAKD